MSDTGFPSPPVQHAEVDGRRLAYREYGAGQPAVLVHGLGGMSTNWTDLMHALPLHCFAIDLPGFGYSDPLDGVASLERMAQAVGSFIATRFPGQRVHLLGNSLGADVVIILASQRPELVRSVTLVSPAMPTLLPRRTNYQVPIVALPWLGERLFRKWQALGLEQRVWGTVRVIFGDPAAIDRVRLGEMMAETAHRDAVAHGADVYLGAVRALLRTFLRSADRGLWRRLAAISAPLLVIHGRRDLLVDSAQAHRVARERPGAAVALLMRSAHVSQMEFPGEVAALWRRFIAPTAS